ncbi:46305_t:CDS:2 [Gigaspora margarita]|uniref:46305_t:CDS:1 n=1 Tax=Gigaspora margarita TaxID=4874 RepID=A0ABM8VZF6_GIGMA|nr:46305_t:CDS:2 [Gigaspora margarita]
MDLGFERDDSCYVDKFEVHTIYCDKINFYSSWSSSAKINKKFEDHAVYCNATNLLLIVIYGFGILKEMIPGT